MNEVSIGPLRSNEIIQLKKGETVTIIRTPGHYNQSPLLFSLNCHGIPHLGHCGKNTKLVANVKKYFSKSVILFLGEK